MTKPPLDTVAKLSRDFSETDSTHEDKRADDPVKIPKVKKLEIESLNHLILIYLLLKLEGPSGLEDETNRWKAYAKCYVAEHDTDCLSAIRNVRREIYREIKKVVFNWFIIAGILATIAAAILTS